ncbi:MFS general substrate transporter [Flagelloscypha sp. PMI_526]|nr:MFS general substrate transporter [Flagelloscypha sp. PMI_526]
MTSSGIELQARIESLQEHTPASKPPSHVEYALNLASAPAEADDEFKLPSLTNLIIVIGGSTIHQLSFFIVVSSVSLYSIHLGGDETFSGLVLGIPPVCGGLILLPLVALDGGRYRMPMFLSYGWLILGSILYSLAYPASHLYLILLGRMATGVGYTAFMYSKRYCSDPRIVGVRQRTMLAAWLVVGQGVGLTAGPFLGGLLYKVGFGNEVFNGYTSPGWVMAMTYFALTVGSVYLFRDVPALPAARSATSILRRFLRREKRKMPSSSVTPLDQQPSEQPSSAVRNPSFANLTWNQKGVLLTMSWFSMTNFFILASWEANIPIFTQHVFNYSPYNAGNFIALGGLVAFPVLFLNVLFSRRFQDRTTLAFGSSFGLAGLVLMLVLVTIEKVSKPLYFLCWCVVATGFNLATTCTLSLLSKQLPLEWNPWCSMVIQYAVYIGRVTGAVWGGAGLKVGEAKWLGLQIALVGIGSLMYTHLWKDLKAKTG